jgi:hypothetical protein
MIDAILRAADVMMTNEIGPQLVKPTIHFYADDGRFAGDNPTSFRLSRQVLGPSLQWA